MDIVIFTLQIFSFLGGTVFAYLAAFSYEDEDELFQDSLESWWISLRDVEGGLLKKAKTMLTKSNEIVESFLSRLLNEAATRREKVVTSK